MHSSLVWTRSQHSASLPASLQLTQSPALPSPVRPPYSIPHPSIDLIFCLGGKFAAMHVPVDIRRILSAESAANDGLAYPFLSLAIYLTVETSTRVAIGKWFLIGWLCECSFPRFTSTF